MYILNADVEIFKSGFSATTLTAIGSTPAARASRALGLAGQANADPTFGVLVEEAEAGSLEG
jgi:hypothetical protein